MSSKKGNPASSRGQPAAPSVLDKLRQNPLAARALDKVDLYRDQMEKWLRSNENVLTPYLELAENKTGVNRTYLFSGVLAVITLYLLFGWNAGLLSHLITFVYPAYACLHALETRQKDDDTKWLTYWVVFGFLGHLEFFGEYLLAVLPFYYLVKTGFQVWLFLGGGSLILYHRVIRPLAVKFLHVDRGTLRGQISSKVDQAKDFVRDTETRVRDEFNKSD